MNERISTSTIDFQSFNNKPDYANQQHQLLITPSKHFTVSESGELLYQLNLLKVSLKNLRIDNGSPIIHYILRDKFSGAFYAESFVPKQMPLVEEFLHRAWSWKEDYYFAGLPQNISIPSYSNSQSLSLLLQNLDVQEVQPKFFNESGVRVIRILETELIKYISRNFFFEVQPQMGEVLKEINHNRTPNLALKSEKYDEKWINSIDAVLLPPEIAVMKKAMSKPLNLIKMESKVLCLSSDQIVRKIEIKVLSEPDESTI